jgi:hypothetical protein
MSDQMSLDTIKASLTNPLRAFLWDVIIPNMLGGGDATALQARAQSTQIPGRSVGEINIPYKQTAGIKFPGKLTYDHTWTVTFIEGEDLKVFDAIYGWSQMLVNDNTGVGQGDENIKTNLFFNLISTKSEDIKQVKLEGCYPQKIDTVALTYANDGTVSFTVTFSFDKWSSV